jgi:beta-aspartyl-peptidase (threonine type)
MTNQTVVLVVHGGAGTIERGEMTEELRQQIHQGLREALLAGYRQLTTQPPKQQSSSAALEATVSAVSCLEDNPLFNAGRGSVFNANGHIEMEAAVMDGRQRQVGACTLVKHVRNPIQLARLVMESNDAAFLAYPQAEDLARRAQLPMMPEEYFYTQTRWQQYLKHRQRARSGQSTPEEAVESAMPIPSKTEATEPQKIAAAVMGTVGAVALDSDGNLATSTSTGGRTGKPAQRIGDTPLIGSGTFADNRSCAVSCTGHGEFFIRQMAAADIHARVHYGKQSIMKVFIRGKRVLLHDK